MGSFSLGKPFVHLANLIKEIIERVCLGQLVFWIVVHHTPTHNIDLNCMKHSEHHIFIDVNPKAKL
jgi:hypothetical protein